jgi:hypothetical protein
MSRDRTFSPYCIFATTGFSDKKMKRRRRMENGIGTIKVMKTTISAMRRANT